DHQYIPTQHFSLHDALPIFINRNVEGQFLELKDYILIKPAVRRKIITTSDGSSTLYMEDLGETYHSIHGAIQEANHVYIQNGLRSEEHTSELQSRENIVCRL